MSTENPGGPSSDESTQPAPPPQAAGAGTTGQPETAASAAAAAKREKEEMGSPEVRVEKAMRWRVWSPYLFLNTGGMAIVRETLISLNESATRTIASGMEMDPFIAKKQEVSKVIRQAFHGQSGEADSPATVKDHVGNSAIVVAAALVVLTFASAYGYAGLFASSLGALVALRMLRGRIGRSLRAINDIHEYQFAPDVRPVFSLALGLVLMVSVIMKVWVTDSMGFIPTVALTATMIGFFGGGLKKVDIAHGGVLTVFGQRQYVELAEGWHWTLMGVTGLEQVDLREQFTELKGENALAVITGNTEGAGSDVPPISDEIDRNFSKTSGVDVIEDIFVQILPKNHEIQQARDRVAIEKAEADAELIEATSVVVIADKAKALGVSPDEALRFAQAQKGILERKETIFRVEGGTEGDKLVGAVAAAAEAWRGSQGGQSQHGQGRHGRRRNRNRNRGGWGGNPQT